MSGAAAALSSLRNSQRLREQQEEHDEEFWRSEHKLRKKLLNDKEAELKQSNFNSLELKFMELFALIKQLRG